MLNFYSAPSNLSFDSEFSTMNHEGDMFIFGFILGHRFIKYNQSIFSNTNLEPFVPHPEALLQS